MRKGSSLTAEQKAHLSAIRKGKPKSAEHRKSLSRSLTGRKLSKEHIQSIKATRGKSAEFLSEANKVIKDEYKKLQYTVRKEAWRVRSFGTDAAYVAKEAWAANCKNVWKTYRSIENGSIYQTLPKVNANYLLPKTSMVETPKGKSIWETDPLLIQAHKDHENHLNEIAERKSLKEEQKKSGQQNYRKRPRSHKAKPFIDSFGDNEFLTAPCKKCGNHMIKMVPSDKIQRDPKVRYNTFWYNCTTKGCTNRVFKASALKFPSEIKEKNDYNSSTYAIIGRLTRQKRELQKEFEEKDKLLSNVSSLSDLDDETSEILERVMFLDESLQNINQKLQEYGL